MPVIVLSVSNINLVNAHFYWLFHTTQIWVVLLLIGHAVRKICFNQSEALPDLSSDTSSIWNFRAPSSDIISWGNQCQVFSQATSMFAASVT